jgi:hypothetical protein
MANFSDHIFTVYGLWDSIHSLMARTYQKLVQTHFSMVLRTTSYDKNSCKNNRKFGKGLFQGSVPALPRPGSKTSAVGPEDA